MKNAKNLSKSFTLSDSDLDPKNPDDSDFEDGIDEYPKPKEDRIPEDDYDY